MVRAARTKKRRAGRIGKVKRKGSNFKRWDPNLKPNKLVKDFWDKSKSPAANLASMGLVAKPNLLIMGEHTRGISNRHANPVDANVTEETKAAVIQLFEVPESDEININKRAEKQYSLTEDQELYMARCMGKHGDNYTAMFRDIKTNYMQETKEKLRKWGARYLLLPSHHRHVEIPDTVKHLVLQYE